MNDARVALLAVLIAPVGIVETVVGQPVHLVGRGSLCTALRGVTPCDERQRVLRVEHLLHAEIVAQGVIERALYISFASIAIGETHRPRPAFGIIA